MALRLRRLKITRFRDVRPGTELHFNDEWNVVLGHNATGKTTLLNLVSMALRGDFRELGDESFALEYELGDEEVTLSASLSNEVAQGRAVAPGDPALLMDRRTLTERRTRLLARITSAAGSILIGTPPLPMTAGERTLEVTTEHDLLVAFVVWQAREQVVELVEPIVNGWFDRAGLNGFRFDEALEMFRSLHGVLGDAAGVPQQRDVLVFVMGDKVFPAMTLVPRTTWAPFNAHESPTSVQAAFDGCEHLAWAARRLGGSIFHAVYPVTNSTTSQGAITVTLGPPTITLRRTDGSTVSVKQFSFGQKRLFTFAWYLDSNPGPVVADELVNGMHYEWIDECVRAMEGRQKFLTAQNPLLLDHVDIASEEDVMRSFILCRAETTDGRRQVVWANPTGEQAAEFFRAYQNGVLRVHEILRTEGLW